MNQNNFRILFASH